MADVLVELCLIAAAAKCIARRHGLSGEPDRIVLRSELIQMLLSSCNECILLVALFTR
jgi:hypothetical protein